MKLVKKIIDKYYTDKIIESIEEFVTRKRLIYITAIETRKEVKLYYNFSISEKELKRDIPLLLLNKAESCINFTRNMDNIFAYIEKRIEEEEKK